MLELLCLFQEVFLFAAYLSSGPSFPSPLTSKEEREALIALKAGDPEAREKLIQHNLRLVAHIAKKYQGSDLDQDDLISIGTVGLIKSIGTFDPDKGANLVTYSAKCIQNEILMALRAGKKHKGEVSLADSIGKDKEGNEITLVDVMGTPPNAVSDEVELRLQVQKLHELIGSSLTDREKIVIELRYGLRNGPCLPQREVANMLDISRSYVSRIEKKALCKLNQAFSTLTLEKTGNHFSEAWSRPREHERKRKTARNEQ